MVYEPRFLFQNTFTLCLATTSQTILMFIRIPDMINVRDGFSPNSICLPEPRCTLGSQSSQLPLPSVHSRFATKVQKQPTSRVLGSEVLMYVTLCTVPADSISVLHNTVRL